MYEVGDRVIVRDWDDMASEFGVERNNSFIYTKPFFFHSFARYLCGKVVTIAGRYRNGDMIYYDVCETHRHYFVDDMFEDFEQPFDDSWVEGMLSDMNVGGDEM